MSRDSNPSDASGCLINDRNGLVAVYARILTAANKSFRCSRGQLVAERRNRGYTLYRAGSGTPIARLRPIGQNDRVEVLYWSLWKERWTSAGPFGRTILPIDDALHFIASAALHRFRGHLLGCGITSGAVENAESPA